MKLPILSALCLGLLATGCATTPPAPGSAAPAAPASLWSPGPVEDYEPRSPGLGWSQRYTSDAGWADIYFYDMGRLWQSTDEVAAEGGPFHMALQEIQLLATRGSYTDLRILGIDVQSLEKIDFLHAVASYRLNDGPVESHLYLTLHEGKLLKLRVSLREPVSEASRRSINDIVAQHLVRLRRANSI